MKPYKDIIKESERNRILGLYNRPLVSESIVITDWLSPDEKYCIFLDELYDIDKKIKIGNIWENFDHFKFFLKHSFEVANNISQDIKESVLNSINSLVITESNQNIIGLKPYVKELLNENVFGDAWDWMKEKGKEAVSGVTSFAKTSWEGIKKTYNYIKDGDWKAAFDIIKKGVLYVARKIRAALYHPVGLILDAILVATGIGKGLQFVIWSVIVGLDIYELVTKNYEDPNMSIEWRLFYLGIDILGLVFAASVAKTSKGAVGSLMRKFGSTSEGFTKSVQSSKFLQTTIEKIVGSTNKAKQLIGEAMTKLQKSSPKIYSFLVTPMRWFGNVVSMIVKYLGKGLKYGMKGVSAPGKFISKSLGGEKLGMAAQSAFNVGAPTVAIGAYEKGKEREQYQQIAKAVEGSNVKPNYDNIEW